MNKPVVNLCDFLRKIETSYKQHRAAYENAASLWTKEVERWKLETSRGWNDPLQCQSDTAAHNQKMQQLRAALEDVERSAAADFKEIRAAAVKMFEPLNHPNPATIDSGVLQLLSEGVYTDSEIRALAIRFQGNIGMLRCIGKAAAQRAEKNPEMRSLASSCASASVPRLEYVDSLVHYASSALRADSNTTNKEAAISKSAGIAAIFDAEAERIITEARNANIYVELPENPGEGHSAEGGNG